MLQLLAALLDDQARVARAEAALAAAKKRMALSEQRLGRLRAGRGAEVRESAPAAAVTLRTRIVEAMKARRGEVLTPAKIAALVGATNRDSVRNTLLVLAGQGRIEKVGVGQYRAKGG